MTDDQLYKAWWFAVAYGAGTARRMEIIDRLRNKYAEPIVALSPSDQAGLEADLRH